jgi:serine/threonine protein kinase
VCDHPNILKLVEAFTMATEDEDDKINIVMRPWAPFTLQKFLESSEEKRRAQCPWFQPGSPQSDWCTYRIMQQLAEAVAYLHRRSTKHKDIKPDNILLHEPESIPPRAIVADVGVSKVLVHNGSTKYDDCSYPYLALEQVKKRDSSIRADVWQLGCCFALLLAVSKAGTLGYRRLWISFSRSGEDCSCQIAGEHGHFMKSFRDIFSPRSWADREASSLVANMLDPVHETRIDIKEVFASVGALLRQARKDGTDDVVMTE